MLQELEICASGLFIISVMFYLFIDVAKRNKAGAKVKSTTKEINHLSQTKTSAEGVYPLYIDCSRNSNRTFAHDDQLITYP